MYWMGIAEQEQDFAAQSVRFLMSYSLQIGAVIVCEKVDR
jgi:hypothetical protein